MRASERSLAPVDFEKMRPSNSRCFYSPHLLPDADGSPDFAANNQRSAADGDQIIG